MKLILLSVFMVLFCSLLQAQNVDSSQTSSKKDTFYILDQLPVFPGGDAALMTYLRNSISYPKEARDSAIMGTVFVTFVIETDGSVSNVKVLRGIGGGCDEEAIRVVEGMPNWTPGMQKGKPVRAQFNLPIRFIIDKTPADSEISKKKKKK